MIKTNFDFRVIFKNPPKIKNPDRKHFKASIRMFSFSKNEIYLSHTFPKSKELLIATQYVFKIILHFFSTALLPFLTSI
jgi:hypothetical protein